MSRGPAVLALLALAGCTYSADFNGARFACDSLTPCPDGSQCIEGYCQAAAIDAADLSDAAGSSPDAGSGDDRLRWMDHTVGTVELSGAESVESDMIAGGPGDLFVVFVSTKPAREVTGVTGLGLEWNDQRQICTGRSTARLAMFWALAADAVAGKVKAALDTTPGDGSAVISVHRYAGADPTNPVGHTSVANTTGHDGDLACSGGVDSDTYSWSTLDTAGVDSIVVSGVHTANYPSHQPGDGFTERSDDQSGMTSISAGVAVEERRVADPTSDVTISGGWENAPDWAAIAAVLRD